MILRWLLCKDGRCKANFVDKSVVILEPDATLFTICLADGRQIRQMSEFVTSGYCMQLCLTLHLRNLFGEEPYLPQRLLAPLGKESFTSRQKYYTAQWPLSLAAGLSCGLIHTDKDGYVVVRSFANAAPASELRLSPSGGMFSVTYPFLVGEVKGRVEAQAPEVPRVYTYTMHTQVFSAHATPEAWRYPLQLACEHHRHQNQPHCASPPHEPWHLSLPFGHGQPIASLDTQRPTTARLQSISTLPAAAPTATHARVKEVRWSRYLPDSFWCASSTVLYPEAKDVTQGLVEWTAQALHVFAPFQTSRPPATAAGHAKAPSSLPLLLSSPSPTSPSDLVVVDSTLWADGSALRVFHRGSALFVQHTYVSTGDGTGSAIRVASEHPLACDPVAAFLCRCQQRRGTCVGSMPRSGGPAGQLGSPPHLVNLASRDPAVHRAGTMSDACGLRSSLNSMSTPQAVRTQDEPPTPALTVPGGVASGEPRPKTVSGCAPIQGGAMTSECLGGCQGDAALGDRRQHSGDEQPRPTKPASTGTCRGCTGDADHVPCCRVYAAAAVPAKVRFADSSGSNLRPHSYELASIAQRAMALLHACTEAVAWQQEADGVQGLPTASEVAGLSTGWKPVAGVSSGSLGRTRGGKGVNNGRDGSHGRDGALAHWPAVPPLDNHIVEEVDLPGIGRLTAYADGRVRAVFEDRTLLRLDGDRAVCHLVLPDGTVTCAGSKVPEHVWRHVQVAAQFATWAFQSPAQRGWRQQRQVAVDAHVGLTGRFLALTGDAAPLPERFIRRGGRSGAGAWGGEEREGYGRWEGSGSWVCGDADGGMAGGSNVPIIGGEGISDSVPISDNARVADEWARCHDPVSEAFDAAAGSADVFSPTDAPVEETHAKGGMDASDCMDGHPPLALLPGSLAAWQLRERLVVELVNSNRACLSLLRDGCVR
eukprot:jgi/Mesvir1/19661/Mv09940-RA.1